MYKVKTLIISNRKELSIKYKKLIENLSQNALYTNDLSSALSIIQKQNIEFIIISDTIKENLSDFIQKIRILTYNFRPIIIAVSKSNDLEDRLLALEAGADEVLGEEISKSEFQMRFRAHLRRYFESSINPITKILEKNITQKAITSTLLEDLPYAYLLIKIEGIEHYQKTYGEIAYEKVLQTLSAIVNSTLSNDDFIGHVKDEEFILITNPINAEKIALFLTFAFDNILNKFYSTDEFENQFVIKSSDYTKENKSALMRLYISACEKQNQKTYQEVLSSLYSLILPIEKQNNLKSAYIIDRIRLKGETQEIKKNNIVLFFEKDRALSCLLKNVCELNEIEAILAFSKDEFIKQYQKNLPKIVMLDWGQDGVEALSLAKEIKKDNIKMIFSSSFLNKKEILKSGADFYIPKPYDIDDIISWIKKYLKG